MERALVVDEVDQSTILRVDDEPAIRESVQRLLRHEKLIFLEAGDGREALRVLDEHDIHLVLLDLQILRMNGSEFLRHYRDSTMSRGTPVCVMTGESASSDRVRFTDDEEA